jgi:hypothetical protein
MYVRSVEAEAKAAIAAGYWGYSEHWNPGNEMSVPFLLLVGVVGLLINRWWSHLLSLVASVPVIYQLGYLPWKSLRFMQDAPPMLFSLRAVEKLWLVIYRPHPQYLAELTIAVVVLAYAVVLLSKLMLARSHRSIVGT